MLDAAGQRALGDCSELPSAAGLKLHLVSDRSLIPHNGIMLCLGTRRISGMVEVSRAVPAVVPAGLHMIDTFQVMRTDSLAEERDLALADLRDIFGVEAATPLPNRARQRIPRPLAGESRAAGARSR